MIMSSHLNQYLKLKYIYGDVSYFLTLINESFIKMMFLNDQSARKWLK